MNPNVYLTMLRPYFGISGPIEHVENNPQFFVGGTLLNDKQFQLKLNEFYGDNNQEWKLIYKAATHGFKTADFHRQCDGEGPTMTIIKSHEGSYLFGAFTKIPWSYTRGFKQDSTAFLFTLIGPTDLPPTKFEIHKRNIDNAVYHSGYGYIGDRYDFYLFGFGGDGLNYRNFYDEFDGVLNVRRGDLFVANRCNKNKYSSTRFPCSYTDPCGLAHTTFTETANFTIADIETYALK